MAQYKLEMKELDFKHTLEFESDGLEDVLANLEIFLKGNGFFFDGILDIHTGTPQTNSMHTVSCKIKYREKDFDDIVKQDDELDIEIK